MILSSQDIIKLTLQISNNIWAKTDHHIPPEIIEDTIRAFIILKEKGALFAKPREDN